MSDRSVEPYVVRGHALDGQQMSAVTDDSPTQLVIAGAGTGKTTTLIGKVRHLVEQGEDPSRILMISLPNNTVADLRGAVESEGGPDFPADVMTINALGNRIYGRRPCVGSVRNGILKRIMYDLVQEDRPFARALMAYIDGMRQAGSSDLSLNGTFIRERGLRTVADALFRCGIGCGYSKAVQSRDGTSPAYISVDHGGVRFELRSDDPAVIDAGRRPGSCYELIGRMGLDCSPINVNDLASNVLMAWNDRIPESIGALISRCKCTRTSIRDLRRANDGNPSSVRATVADKLDLLNRIWDLYALECIGRDMADYDDMVIQSAESVRAGGDPGKMYDHVLIDEYQDVSPILVDLVRALRERMGFGLFCVGDDWQSIYSFSGGDVWQFYDFGSVWGKWGEPSVRRIETTYRCPQQIVEMTSRFVSKNPMQQRKDVRGMHSSESPPVILLPVDSDRGIARMVANRLDHIPAEESVFVIGRTRNDIYAFGGGSSQFRFGQSDARGSGTVDVTYRRWDEDDADWRDVRDLTFLTAHSSKGLEADNVFILVDRDRGGFPSTLSVDIDELFRTRDEGIPYPEERRVLYVAMTRARKRVFLVNRMDDESYALSSETPFMSELIEDNGAMITRSTPFCGECFGPMRIVSYGGRTFYGCCDYPNCRGTREFKGF